VTIVTLVVLSGYPILPLRSFGGMVPRKPLRVALWPCRRGWRSPAAVLPLRGQAWRGVDYFIAPDKLRALVGLGALRHL